MKFFHLSDLHIGKQLHFYSLGELQKDVFLQIARKASEIRPDAIVISGDIYDKAVPSGEAHRLFDFFLNQLAAIEPKIPVLIIAGNHDSAERLSFAGTFLESHQIYISVMPPQEEEEYLKKVVLNDAYGPVNFYLLPFMKPGHVRHLFEEGSITSYDSAIANILGRESIDYGERNVLLSHQFYVHGDQKPETCESEISYINVGGIDSVDIRWVENFDYVALGHIHRPQQVGKGHVRYSGTPLKYSVSEEKHEKSITVVTLDEKGAVPLIETLPLSALRDVRSEKGTLSDIVARATQENCHDYLQVTITDEKEPYRPKDQLEEVYDHILELRIENSRTRAALEDRQEEAIDLDPLSAFKTFYFEVQHTTLSEAEETILTEIISELTEEE